ncbi:hypothetical protein N7492_003984 [Penicillium capsulatum]|uniref:Uncharacterized protein n=1 Tax=Penicillium capsulatum TaxID=69766 RepID=A0A9W9LXF9_9EURO|nr:hypothetical protein N7492_003984 [Penicillium capsulatum]KAJ6121440.1 hypothetical protein N7512_003905 [Penicillium capsulatum]
MARVDVQYAREPVFSKSRPSGEFHSRSQIKDSKLSTAEGRWASKDGGRVPWHRNEASAPEASPFSEPVYHERERASIRSLKIAPNITPSETPWNSSLNDSSEGLDSRAQRSKHVKPKVHIKPMLRKMSRDDAPSTSIDLSRSSTEQEGLGIYMTLERERRQSESMHGVTYRRPPIGLHNRSTSGTSQFSTATGSSGGKPGSQFVYPMRPTPKPHTPSLSHSHQTSLNDSDGLDDEELEAESKEPAAPERHRPVRTSSGPVPRLSLQIEDDSFTHLPGISQTNVASRPSFGYSRDNGSTLDTASPTSRSSLDFMFRSRTRTSTDPISRAATIQAARQAFEEKEAAKTRRFEKQQSKVEERQTRRRVKRNHSGGLESPAAPSSEEMSEKPATTKESRRPNADPRHQPSASWKSQSKSTWVLFMTWLRTRVFKFRRRLRKMS